MTIKSLLDRLLARAPLISALGYAGIVTAMLVTALLALIAVAQHHRSVVAAAELLSRFERHRSASAVADPSATTGSEPAGSPFLEGPTLTVASAVLLQRLTASIVQAGGTVISSEVAPHDVRSNDEFVRVAATCELEQKALQKLLYDIEAGMPFLFVDELVVQAQQPTTADARMHVVLQVSGLWAGPESK